MRVGVSNKITLYLQIGVAYLVFAINYTSANINKVILMQNIQSVCLVDFNLPEFEYEHSWQFYAGPATKEFTGRTRDMYGMKIKVDISHIQ